MIKIFVINGLIMAFGFGLYHLLDLCIEKNLPSLIAGIAPISIAVIGLITLEINCIYKYAVMTAKQKHEKSLNRQKKER